MNRKTFLKLAAAAPFLPLLSIGKEAGQVEVFKDMVVNFDYFLWSDRNTHISYRPAASDQWGKDDLEILVVNDTSDPHFTRYHIVKDPGTYVLRSRNIVKVKKVVIRLKPRYAAKPARPYAQRGSLDITIYHY